MLGSADGVLAEDTRRARRLFSRWGLRTPPFYSYHDHNEVERLPRILNQLRQGKSLALISDAGTPLLSDPGYRLVRACREQGLRVSPIPGPSAPIAALSASGLPPQPFVFLGFAPRTPSERELFFAPFAQLAATLVFFERKDRLSSTLHTASRILGARDACIAREITKTHEEFIPFVLEEWSGLPQDFAGEITVLIGPPKTVSRTLEGMVDRILAEEAAGGGKPREVARRTLRRVSGWSGKELYLRLRTLSAKAEQ